jgi:dsRNA-specific ribonuclease
MFKNILQEQCQKNGVDLPTYTEVACDGLPHQRMFKYVVEAFGWRAVADAQSSKVAVQ